MSDLQKRDGDPKPVSWIIDRAEELNALLPASQRARFMETLVSTVRADKALHACEPASVLRAAYNAAKLGLTVGTSEAYIIKYGSIATLVPGYKGLIKLMKTSGDAVNVGACPVHEGERYRLAFGEVVEHENDPAYWKNPVLFWYGWALLRNGERVSVIIDHETMRKRDTGRDVWKSNKREMEYKTCIRALANRGKVELNPDMAQTLTALEAQYTEVREVPQQSYRQQLASATIGPAMLEDGTPIIDTDADTIDTEEA